MLIPGPLNPPAPRYWEHTPSMPNRHGGVVANSPADGYTASVRITLPDGTQRVENLVCATLDQAEAWLMEKVNDMPMPASVLVVAGTRHDEPPRRPTSEPYPAIAWPAIP